MPWFPDFSNALELARRQTRSAGRADPVGRYLSSLSSGDTRALETVWPGEVVVDDPRAGEVRGHRRLRHFVRNSQTRLSRRQARIETIASTGVGGRAVVELLAHLNDDGRTVSWPVAVVAESPDHSSVVFRTYCSQWPVDGRRHHRGPVLDRAVAGPGDVVGRYLDALAAGDPEATVRTFAADGYLTEPVGAPDTHRGSAELRSLFAGWFGAGGGIGLQPCQVTDDGVRCAVEYNCLRWGGRELAPQAGLGVCERDGQGLLRAVRIYDDIEPPGRTA